jgi:16S rRNA (guanine966-N2)-methyltransferase
MCPMRVISGVAKGHRIKAPGRPTRPATDLVRGAIFSILENLTDNWENVLDLYSGSGALGIEALSRGAGSVDFVERNPDCCAIIKENLEKTKLTANAHLHCTSVEKAISFLNKEYGIVLIDPPYSDLTIGKIIEQIADSNLIGSNTTVVVTHSSRFALDSVYGKLHMLKEHRHGDSSIAIYQKETTA